MDETKENVDTAVRHKKGEPKGLKQPQAGRFVNEQVKNYRQKTESDAVPKVPAKPETKQGQDHKTVQEEEMEVAAKQQPQLNSGGIYPNIQAGDDQRERTGSGAAGEDHQKGQNQGMQHQVHVAMGNKTNSSGKDRRQEANDLANHAAEKHARYYDGTLKSFCETFPIQKSVSTFNRLKGSKESTEQTVNHLIQGLHTIDFAVSFLVWRTFFMAKDSTSQIYAMTASKTNALSNVFSSTSWPITILLSTGLIIFSPFILGSLFFIVPALLFMFACLLIPAIFIVPAGLFLLIIFDMIPLPNKRPGSVTKNSFGRIQLFNRGPKVDGKEGRNE